MVQLCYAFSKLVLWLIFRIRYGLQVRGQEHVPARGPFIVASNHISFLDPPLLGVACPRRLRFLARADLFHRPLLGCYLRSIGVMPIKRGEADLAGGRGGGWRSFPRGTASSRAGWGRPSGGSACSPLRPASPSFPCWSRAPSRRCPHGRVGFSRRKFGLRSAPRLPILTPLCSSSEGRGSGRARHEQLAEAVTQSWRRLEE